MGYDDGMGTARDARLTAFLSPLAVALRLATGAGALALLLVSGVAQDEQASAAARGTAASLAILLALVVSADLARYAVRRRTPPPSRSEQRRAALLLDETQSAHASRGH
jgi:hypothetical protein